MRKVSVILLFVCSILLLCSSKDSKDSKDSEELKELDFSWVKIDSKEGFINDFKYIEYKLIKKEFKEKYINLLNGSEYIVIDRNDFFSIFEEKSEYYYDSDDHDILKFDYNNNSFIIIRAVKANNPDNSYDILLTPDNELYIIHYSMGSDVYWIDKDVIIISLDEMPNEIYVDFSVAK
jgi:hypothetical protein